MKNVEDSSTNNTGKAHNSELYTIYSGNKFLLLYVLITFLPAQLKKNIKKFIHTEMLTKFIGIVKINSANIMGKRHFSKLYTHYSGN